MKTLLLLLFFWPLILQAQSHENWLTPFATVEFEKDRVVYRYMGNEPVCALEPQFLLPELIIPVPESNPTNMGCKEIMEEMDLFHQYLLNPNHPANDKTDHLRYLKAFALQTVLALGRYELPSESLFEKVHQLTINPDQEISTLARLVTRLYQRVEETLKEKGANINYIHESASSGLFPVMFSSERIVNPGVLSDKVPSDSVVWPKYYGKANMDSYPDNILEIYDGGFMICGNYNTYSGGEFKQWSWLIKTDVNGEVLWDKVIEGGDENMRSIAMELTEDGGILLCGFVWSQIGASDPYVMKLNTCGEKEWCTIFASSTQSNPYRIL